MSLTSGFLTAKNIVWWPCPTRLDRTTTIHHTLLRSYSRSVKFGNQTSQPPSQINLDGCREQKHRVTKNPSSSVCRKVHARSQTAALIPSRRPTLHRLRTLMLSARSRCCVSPSKSRTNDAGNAMLAIAGCGNVVQRPDTNREEVITCAMKRTGINSQLFADQAGRYVPTFGCQGRRVQ